MIDAYHLLLFAHVVAFAYWLGGDLGVFFCAGRVANPDLALDERLRWLGCALTVDMAPRSALILILAIGFHLAVMQAWLPLDAVWVGLGWALAAIWLALGWIAFAREGQPIAHTARRIDRPIRLAMMGLVLAAGVSSLAYGWPLATPWLAAKLVLFGLIIVVGLMLRGVVDYWLRGFALLRAGNTADGEALIHRGHVLGERWAYAIWALVALAAFLGVTKWWPW